MGTTEDNVMLSLRRTPCIGGTTSAKQLAKSTSFFASGVPGLLRGLLGLREATEAQYGYGRLTYLLLLLGWKGAYHKVPR
jgi:hypothetical protein